MIYLYIYQVVIEIFIIDQTECKLKSLVALKAILPFDWILQVVSVYSFCLIQIIWLFYKFLVSVVN